MITTLTLNPSLDLNGQVEALVANEKNYASDFAFDPGGNAINAGRILTRLGADVRLTGFLGGATGQRIRNLLREEGLNCKFIPIEGESRINVTLSLRKSHEQTRISFPGPAVSASEERALRRLLEKPGREKLLIVGGSLPGDFSVRRFRALLTDLSRGGWKIVLDVPGPVLKSCLSVRPLLIKPNLTEFQQATGLRGEKTEDVLKAARRLNRSVPLVCISSVDGGALLVSKHQAWFGRTPKLKLRSTVGAGDSMVGAMSREILRRKLHLLSEEELAEAVLNSGDEILRWGLAAAAATLSSTGTTLGKADAIRTFRQKIDVRAASESLK